MSDEYMIRCTRSGWGAIRNPLDESEYLQLDAGEYRTDDADLAHALVSTYGDAFVLESTPDAPSKDVPTPVEDNDDSVEDDDGDGEDEEEHVVPTCAGEKSDGTSCTREVSEPGDYCWQHAPISEADDEDEEE